MIRVVSVKFEFPDLPTQDVQDCLVNRLVDIGIKVVDSWESSDERPQNVEAVKPNTFGSSSMQDYDPTKMTTIN